MDLELKAIPPPDHEEWGTPASDRLQSNLRLEISPVALAYHFTHEIPPLDQAGIAQHPVRISMATSVEVVADAGINDKVVTGVWDGAVAALVTAIKAGRPADGLVAADVQCGGVLAVLFPPGALKRNELPDKLLVI